MNVKQTSYLPALDGMRAISIMLVFISHMVYSSGIYLGNFIPGGFGVTIFFYISGFLITRLLLEEASHRKTISLKMFYIRRVLRLYPPLLVMLLLITLYLLIVKHFIPYKELLAALFYYENYYLILFSPKVFYYGILWSLAIEEHFYLFYPLLFLIFIKKPKQFIVVIVILLIVSLLARFAIASKYNANHFSYDSTFGLSHYRFDSILYGCLSALLINSRFADKFKAITSNKIIFGLAIAGILFSLTYRNEYFRQTARYSLQGLSLLVVVTAIIYSYTYSALNKILSSRYMVTLGKWSYSIYLFHAVVIIFLDDLPTKNKLVYVVLYLVGSLSLSILSYYYVEQPFFKLRKKFGSRIQEEKLPPATYESAAVKLV